MPYVICNATEDQPIFCSGWKLASLGKPFKRCFVLDCQHRVPKGNDPVAPQFPQFPGYIFPRPSDHLSNLFVIQGELHGGACLCRHPVEQELA
jgi:hypothetical protein